MNKILIRELIQKQNPVIFEIGCADGGDTQEFIDIFKTTNFKLYCFEPEFTNIKVFKDRNFPENVQLFEGVISNSTETLKFHRSRNERDYNDLRYSGSIKSPKYHTQQWPHIKFDEYDEVQSTTLDLFCTENQIDIIDFIWADVQGAEDLMIMGGKETFDKKVRYLYTEYSTCEFYDGAPNQFKILELLGNNWEIINDFGTDVLLKNKNV